MRSQGVPTLRGPLRHRAVVAIRRLPALDQMQWNHGHALTARHPARHHAALGVDSAVLRPDLDAPPDAAALKPVARKT